MGTSPKHNWRIDFATLWYWNMNRPSHVAGLKSTPILLPFLITSYIVIDNVQIYIYTHIYIYIYTPICSMYRIFTNIGPKNHPNAGKYTIHGAYGYPQNHPFFGSMKSTTGRIPCRATWRRTWFSGPASIPRAATSNPAMERLEFQFAKLRITLKTLSFGGWFPQFS
jgi:hypothetical protein